MSRASNWVPKQHGAWAMLIVPALIGTILRVRTIGAEWWLLPFFVAIITGYLAFNAVTIWAKAAPKRRPQFVPASLTYSVIALISGVVTVALAGLEILWWAPAALVLLTIALALASQRQDRALLSGLVTTAAASGLGFVARFTTPQTMMDAWPNHASDIIALLAVFGYFFGTVVHVKALLRERGQATARRRTVAYHIVFAALTFVAWGLGWLTFAWPMFAIALVARTIAMTMPANEGRFSALAIGIVEIVASVVLIIVSLL